MFAVAPILQNYLVLCIALVFPTATYGETQAAVANFGEKLDPALLLEKTSIFGYYSGTNTGPNQGL